MGLLRRIGALSALSIQLLSAFILAESAKDIKKKGLADR